MEDRSSHLTVVVGHTALADDVRRQLVQHGVEHVGVSTHLRGLRSTMVKAEHDAVILCIVLDASTIRQFGPDLQRLLDDHRCYPAEVRSIGVLPHGDLHRDALTIGCDVFATQVSDVAEFACELADSALVAATTQLASPMASASVVPTTNRLVWRHGLTEAESRARLRAARRCLRWNVDLDD
ncbi:MAG: hypothetical protein AAF479_17395 [Pseudomonadota bacterium]